VKSNGEQTVLLFTSIEVKSNGEQTVHERLFEVFTTGETTGIVLTEKVLAVLKEMKFDLEWIVGQCYDMTQATCEEDIAVWQLTSRDIAAKHCTRSAVPRTQTDSRSECRCFVQSGC
jgi:hypothetical protein